MNKRQRFLDYLLITSFVWGLYLIWLIPFMLFWVGLAEHMDKFVNWIIWGTIFQMIFSYPIIKASIRYGPKITAWIKKKTCDCHCHIEFDEMIACADCECHE